MNYIKLINSFYDRLETNALSTSAIALWHALVHINNKAGWRSEFTVAVSVLRIKSGLSEKSVSNARNELTQKGYIDFKSRKGNQSAIYQLIDLSVTVTDKVAGNVSDSSSGNTTGNASALIKQNETKQNETINDYHLSLGEVQAPPKESMMIDDDFKKVIHFVSNNIQTVTPIIGEKVGYLVDQYNTELIIKALETSVLASARNKLGYAETTLRNWKSELITTVEQLEAKQNRARNTQNRLFKQQETKSLFEPSEETLKREEETMERFRVKKERGDYDNDECEFD